MNNTTGGKQRREIVNERELPNSSQYEDSEGGVGDVLSESKVIENALITEPQTSYPSQKYDHLATNRDISGSRVILGATSTMPIGV